MRARLLILCLTTAFTGCMVGANYNRPQTPAPAQFRAGDAQPSQASLGDTRWFDLFDDETLRGLIKEALQANYDIRIAAQRVLAAQGQLTATRSGLFPQLSGPGSISRTGLRAPIQSVGLQGYSTLWELDF